MARQSGQNDDLGSNKVKYACDVRVWDREHNMWPPWKCAFRVMSNSLQLEAWQISGRDFNLFILLTLPTHSLICQQLTLMVRHTFYGISSILILYHFPPINQFQLLPLWKPLLHGLGNIFFWFSTLDGHCFVQLHKGKGKVF